MSETEPLILLRSDDPSLTADVAAAMDESFNARVVAADSDDEAREFLDTCDFDLTIADQPAELDDSGLIAIATSRSIPTVMIEPCIDADRVLAALRLGVVDVLPRPVDFEQLENVARAALTAQQNHRRSVDRQRRVRDLSTRVLRDRRELRQRIDLLCKDLVHAYRRLADKVVSFETRPRD